MQLAVFTAHFEAAPLLIAKLEKATIHLADSHGGGDNKLKKNEAVRGRNRGYWPELQTDDRGIATRSRDKPKAFIHLSGASGNNYIMARACLRSISAAGRFDFSYITIGATIVRNSRLRGCSFIVVDETQIHRMKYIHKEYKVICEAIKQIYGHRLCHDLYIGRRNAVGRRLTDHGCLMKVMPDIGCNTVAQK